MSNDNSAKSTPLSNAKSTPLALSAQLCCRNRYLSSDQIKKISIEIFKSKGRGIIYADLLEKGLANHAQQSQGTLKYHLKKGTLFTLGDKRPQRYYPSAIRSDIIEKLQKNTPLDPSGVAYSNTLPISKSVAPLANCLDPIIIQILIGYVLPLLPNTPSFIHNLHFKTRVSHECYEELNLPHYNNNYGKYHTEIIGKTRVDYVLYSSGTVIVHTTCSNNPYKIETEEDHSRLLTFFGHMRGNLVNFLNDSHERIVPDIMGWYLTECDINKDIKVSDLFHLSGINIQVRHLDHLFSVYIKSMGKDTVCRIEERKHPTKMPAIEFIHDIFNPVERIENQISGLEKKVERIVQWLEGNNNNNILKP